MSMGSIRTAQLPQAWFRRRQYRPRVRDDRGEKWFLEAGIANPVVELPPLEAVPSVSPELKISPHERRKAVAAALNGTWSARPGSVQRSSFRFEVRRILRVRRPPPDTSIT